MDNFIKRILDRNHRKIVIEKHRKMWRWLAEHPDKGKLDYFMMHDPSARMNNSCYLCDYAVNKSVHEGRNAWSYCEYCPVDWGGKPCKHYASLFDKWWKSKWGPLEERAEIAKQIAELPERKDI